MRFSLQIDNYKRNQSRRRTARQDLCASLQALRRGLPLRRRHQRLLWGPGVARLIAVAQPIKFVVYLYVLISSNKHVFNIYIMRKRRPLLTKFIKRGK